MGLISRVSSRTYRVMSVQRNRVFIGGISRDTREDDIKDKFGKFGRIKDVFLRPQYAFVEFEDKRDAEDAIDELHNSRFLDKRITVEFTKRSCPDMHFQSDGGRRGGGARSGGRPTYYRLKIGNLTTRYEWRDLK